MYIFQTDAVVVYTNHKKISAIKKVAISARFITKYVGCLIVFYYVLNA